jgi:uncharacterized membrane protein YphA (DoxX/SURF4 family)
MKYIAIISRVLVGIVFVFSGFVKAIDPLGSAYKFMDYFAAFNMTFLDEMSLFFSIALSALEFVIGIALLFGLKSKYATWGGLIFMGVFTPLTLYLAITNPVSDCGCFGDAILLSNWETFYKNIVFLILIVIAFAYKNKFSSFLSCKKQWAGIVIALIISAGISVYSYRHLPLIDFLDWKVGNSMKLDKEMEEKFFVIYENKETGERQEFISPDFPWNDSVWMANWFFVDQRVETPPRPDNLIFIVDEYGENLSYQITQNPDFQFMLIVYSVENTKLRVFEKINEFAQKSFDKNIDFVALTGSAPDDASAFAERIHAAFPFYFADAITLKTVVRANPGLVLLKDGVILAKWHFNDIPDFNSIQFEKLERKYLKN